jgi:hypothetical protein
LADQSHIDAMRAAVRGDLERARARNPAIFEGRVAVEPVDEVETAEPEPELEPSPPPVTEQAPAAYQTPVMEVQPEPDPPPPPARRSFWSRLFRR